MAKLVGFRQSLPVQAAAGWQAELATPAGVLLATGVVVAGLLVGTFVGGAVGRNQSFMQTQPIKAREVSNAEAVIVTGAVGGGVYMSAQVMQQLVTQFGWRNLGIYTSGLGALVLLRKAFR